MTQYDNTNRGGVWPNKRKDTDKHADFAGSQNVVCPKCNEPTDYWLDAWKRKQDANPNGPSLSTRLRPKDGKPRDADRTPETGSSRDMDDEIPF
jgi:hypothetical protein